MPGAGRKGSWPSWGLSGEMQVGTLQADGPIRSGGGRGASVWCVQGLSSGMLGALRNRGVIGGARQCMSFLWGAAGRPCNVQFRSCMETSQEAAVAGLGGRRGLKQGGRARWLPDEARGTFLEQLLLLLPTAAETQLFSFIEQKSSNLCGKASELPADFAAKLWISQRKITPWPPPLSPHRT